ncbi:helix-turn-helix domain-containing protein [Enterococcus sp. DIV0756]|uniref:helix-turn-helix domain-containing protein n=1 Tax=Enterococcus sp. DIV0756 TaxID=2774636 RepID=UPI003F20463E
MIGYLLKLKRLVAGYDMKEIAEMGHISIPHLSNIEGNRRVPSIEFLISIENCYGVRSEFVENESLVVKDQLVLALQSTIRGEYRTFKKLREDILSHELTVETYFSIELMDLAFQNDALYNQKISHFLCDILNNEKENYSYSLLLEVLYIYCIHSEMSTGHLTKSIELSDELMELTANKETKAYLVILNLLLKWESGMRSELLKELPEVRDMKNSVQEKTYFMDAWNYLYGQCMLYYGFSEEATYFLEKNIKDINYDKKSEGFVRQCISKVLLYSYTNSNLVSSENVFEAIIERLNDEDYIRDFEAYVYTFATVLLSENRMNEANELVKKLEAKNNEKLNHPNRLFYEFMLSFYNEQYIRCESISEDFFSEERNVSINPFQGVDICKKMIQIFEVRKRYKQAAIWGKVAIKISNTYFGCKSLV